MIGADLLISSRSMSSLLTSERGPKISGTIAAEEASALSKRESPARPYPLGASFAAARGVIL